MTYAQLQQFFMWCSLLNMGLLTILFLTIMPLHSRVCRIHSRLFKIPEETVSHSLYILFGIWKIVAFVFFVFPWLALQFIS